MSQVSRFVCGQHTVELYYIYFTEHKYVYTNSRLPKRVINDIIQESFCWFPSHRVPATCHAMLHYRSPHNSAPCRTIGQLLATHLTGPTIFTLRYFGITTTAYRLLYYGYLCYELFAEHNGFLFIFERQEMIVWLQTGLILLPTLVFFFGSL